MIDFSDSPNWRSRRTARDDEEEGLGVFQWFLVVVVIVAFIGLGAIS